MFLGVDGGGTKTAFCLIDDNGTVVGERRERSMHYFGEGVGLVEAVLRQGIGAICEAAGTTPEDLSYSFIAIPCYGEVSADLPILDSIPRRVLHTDRYACGNDMVPGWAGSLGGVDGINIIAGTGSMTYGERAGARGRTGGWGELFGDEGSGYWVAVRGLNAFTRMSDGRLPAGPLLDTVRAALDLSSDFDVIDIVLNQWRGDRAKIAALGPLVSAAADAGDQIAREILRDAGRELAGLVDAQAAALGYGTGEPVPLSWSGGVFGSPHVRAAFAEAVQASPWTYDLREPLLPPHIGAALYAARLAGVQLSAEQLHLLQSTQHHN